MWLRARPTRSYLAACVACLVLVLLVGPVDLPVPRLGVGPAPFLLLLPTITSVALVHLLAGSLQLHEALSARPVALIAAGVVAVTLAATVAVWTIWGSTQGGLGAAASASRNLVGYTGLALLAARAFGDLAGYLAPGAYALLTAVLGGPGNPVWWALSAPSDVRGHLVAGVLLACGCLAALPRSAQLRMALRRDEGHT